MPLAIASAMRLWYFELISLVYSPSLDMKPSSASTQANWLSRVM